MSDNKVSKSKIDLNLDLKSSELMRIVAYRANTLAKELSSYESMEKFGITPPADVSDELQKMQATLTLIETRLTK